MLSQLNLKVEQYRAILWPSDENNTEYRKLLTPIARMRYD